MFFKKPRYKLVRLKNTSPVTAPSANATGFTIIVHGIAKNAA